MMTRMTTVMILVITKMMVRMLQMTVMMNMGWWRWTRRKIMTNCVAFKLYYNFCTLHHSNCIQSLFWIFSWLLYFPAIFFWISGAVGHWQLQPGDHINAIFTSTEFFIESFFGWAHLKPKLPNQNLPKQIYPTNPGKVKLWIVDCVETLTKGKKTQPLGPSRFWQW